MGHDHEGDGAGEEKREIGHGDVENGIAGVWLIGAIVTGIVELCKEEETDGKCLDQCVGCDMKRKPWF